MAEWTCVALDTNAQMAVVRQAMISWRPGEKRCEGRCGQQLFSHGRPQAVPEALAVVIVDEHAPAVLRLSSLLGRRKLSHWDRDTSKRRSPRSRLRRLVAGEESGKSSRQTPCNLLTEQSGTSGAALAAVSVSVA